MRRSKLLVVVSLRDSSFGKRSRYGYYKFFVSEEAKNGLLKYAQIAKRKCDTPENHLHEFFYSSKARGAILFFHKKYSKGGYQHEKHY